MDLGHRLLYLGLGKDLRTSLILVDQAQVLHGSSGMVVERLWSLSSRSGESGIDSHGWKIGAERAEGKSKNGGPVRPPLLGDRRSVSANSFSPGGCPQG